ncbi:bifunctional ATPase [Babesia duncani]|uniref:Bifunctional ATPase n=1 Tax=Babesia duncani TaxID=323732 RepID=A0AAD9PN29_9APIC|nr:bifunctional ATPase [Babesia duncani]
MYTRITGAFYSTLKNSIKDRCNYELRNITTKATLTCDGKYRDNGGVYKNPLLKLHRHKETEEYNNIISMICDSPEKKIIKKIISKRKNDLYEGTEVDEDFYELGNELLNVQFQAQHLAPRASKVLQSKIDEIVNQRFNFNAISKFRESQSECSRDFNVSRENTTRTESEQIYSSSQQGSKNKPFNIYEALDTIDENEHHLNVWKAEYSDCTRIQYNNCIIPYEFKEHGNASEYRNMRVNAALLDKAYCYCTFVSGENAANVLDQLVTCSVSKMDLFDIQYGCLVDSRANVLDTCYVCKFDDGYLLLVNGHNKKNIYDYISAYVLHCSEANLKVSITPCDFTVLSLYGPKSCNVLNDLVMQNTSKGEVRFSLEKMPEFMKCTKASCKTSSDNLFELYLARITDTGEDGFDIVLPRSQWSGIARALLSHESVGPCGFKIYNVARLESGFLRSNVDLPPETSPQQAGVLWSVDYHKLKNGMIFGSNFMRYSLTNGVSKIRVGLLSHVPLDNDCKILLEATRMPIGFVTSCVKSPALNMYISHAYVNTAYAKHDMPVILSMAAKPDCITSKRDYRLHYRTGVYRNFSKGTIVHLPFLLHKYPILDTERDIVGGNQKPFSRPKKESISMETNSTSCIKSKREIWKERVQLARQAKNGTIEMALERFKRIKNQHANEHMFTSKCMDAFTSDAVPIERINLNFQSKTQLEKHYRQAHEMTIAPRHGRYRPQMNSHERKKSPFLLCAVLVSFVAICGNAVSISLGIDWGEEFVKVSIAYPGHKPDILLNDTGSRKFQNAVYLAGNVRAFDKEAFAFTVKNPQWAVHYYAHALGISLDHDKDTFTNEEIVQILRDCQVHLDPQYHPYQYKVQDGQIYVAIKDQEFILLESVAAHFFSYIREIAIAKLASTKFINSIDDPVTISTVLAIPCHYTQAQRNSLKFAATSGGLNVIRIVHGITAAAWLRTLEMSGETHKMLVYDLGSSGANVGILDIEKRASSETKINMLSCVSIPNIGGRAFDFALSQFLREKFESKSGVSLSNLAKSLQKLQRAANKAKTNLTISSTTQVSIEGLTRNADFHDSVTRAEFEKLLEPLLAKIREPIQKALELANVTLDQITSVEIIGGAWRVPIVLETIGKALEPLLLGFHLNAEEAIAMGVGYMAAMSNPFFKMKPVKIADASVHSYTIHVLTREKLPQDVILFSPQSDLHVNKTVKVKTLEDFTLVIRENGKEIHRYQVANVASALATCSPNEIPTVHLNFESAPDGIFKLARAAIAQLPQPVAPVEQKQPAEDPVEQKQPAEGPEEQKQPAEDPEEQKQPAEGPRRSSSRLVDLALVVERAVAISPERLAVSTSTIQELISRDKDIRTLNTHRNNLESAIYKYSSALKTAAFKEHSDAQVQEQVALVLKEQQEWFDVNGHDATLQDLKIRIQAIEQLVHPVLKRQAMHREIMQEMLTADKTVELLKNELLEFEKNNVENEKHSQVQEIITWYENAKMEHSKLQLHQNVVVSRNDIKLKLAEAKALVQEIKKQLAQEQKSQEL